MLPWSLGRLCVSEMRESTAYVQNRDDPYSHAENFGIWALRWSSDGRELLAGTGNDSLYTYDVATSQVCPMTGSRDEGYMVPNNAEDTEVSPVANICIHQFMKSAPVLCASITSQLGAGRHRCLKHVPKLRHRID